MDTHNNLIDSLLEKSAAKKAEQAKLEQQRIEEEKARAPKMQKIYEETKAQIEAVKTHLNGRSGYTVITKSVGTFDGDETYLQINTDYKYAAKFSTRDRFAGVLRVSFSAPGRTTSPLEIRDEAEISKTISEFLKEVIK